MNFLLIGITILIWVIAFFLIKKALKQHKEEKQINKVLSDPHLLLEKLTENGKIIDDGKEVNFEIVKENGKEIVKEKERKTFLPEKKQIKKENSKPIKKKKKR
jgi:hypothetical protein